MLKGDITSSVSVFLFAFVLCVPSLGEAQSKNKNKTQPASSKEESVIDTAAVEAQRRQFALSLITGLADEARSYKDLSLRARVLARSADALWNSDNHTARLLFRRAWEAAEKADAEDYSPPAPSKNSPPVMVIALRRLSGGDLRSEVLNLAARRDRLLGEEFLSKLKEAAEKAAEHPTGDAVDVNDSWTTTDEASKRLRLAYQLLEDDEPEKAFAYALPALTKVNEKSISFLSKLRQKRPAVADKQFVQLMTLSETDPMADANTVSGLSSYAFTPGLYVTFAADGGVRWTPVFDSITAPDLPPNVTSKFFSAAASILLRPLPPAEQDLSSAGESGKYMVMKRLLPLFEQYAPETAVAIRSQLTVLSQSLSRSMIDEDNALLSQGIKSDATAGTTLDKLEERISKTTDTRERDEIYADAAAALAAQGDERARDYADKIDSSYRREMARHYVDVALLQRAIARKDVNAAQRLAKAESLSRVERAWGYMQMGRLFMQSDRTRAVESLETALAEARRVDTDDANKARVMIGIAAQFLNVDNVRPWEVASDAFKAANAADEFNGEPSGLSVAMHTRSGLKLLELDTSAFSLASFIRSLAKLDFTRAHELAKSFRQEAPRALAILAIASSVVENK